MKKKYIASLVAIALFVSGAVFVSKTMAAKQTKENRTVKIKGATPENPVVYLGKSFDKKSGKFVDGYAIVHYAKNAVKPVKPVKPSADAACYGFLAKGAKWKGAAEGWIVDSASTGGLTADFIFENMTKDIDKWEDVVSPSTDILGAGSTKEMTSLPGVYNNENEVSFARIDDSGTIAVTYIWGYFGGALATRQLLEWDQIYNDYYTWSDSGDSDKMDFENIATHELGHSVGMGDLYTSSCATQTMYGYADFGEIDKRDLEAGDIAGINLLY